MCGKEVAAPIRGRIFYTALGEMICYFGDRFAIASLISAILRQIYLGKRVRMEDDGSREEQPTTTLYCT